MMEKLLLNDSTGKKSVTMTAFVLGFLVVNLKLLAAGMKFGEYNMSSFGGSDYSLALSALGAIYVLRRHPSLNGNQDRKDDGDGK